MKKQFLIILIIFTCTALVKLSAQVDTIKTTWYSGTCSGSNGFKAIHFDPAPDTNVISGLDVLWCDGLEFPFSLRNLKPHVQGFHYSGNLVLYDSCTSVLINSRYYGGDTATHGYLMEFYDSAPHYIGLIYGSLDFTKYNDTLQTIYTSYIVDFGTSDPYAGGYTAPEISYVREFTAGDGSYLDEIFDNDRSLLVGIRYYSATNSTTTTRYFKPNN